MKLENLLIAILLTLSLGLIMPVQPSSILVEQTTGV